MTKTAVIIGGGPAGLTAALELLRRTDIKPIVFEGSDGVGGIARTFNHKGNRIDIGGHRFFSKSDRVMQWWIDLLPLQGPAGSGATDVHLGYQNKSRWLEIPADGPNPDLVHDVMLVRPRTSRILYRGKLFDYPLSMNLETLGKLGLIPAFRILVSYLYSAAFPRKDERTLEDFFINRFGRELYETFFREYTEKVWGLRCNQISAEWGAQRIKGLSLIRALKHALKDIFGRARGHDRKTVETTLIEQFLYPKFGPGQLWEKAQSLVEDMGGRVLLNHHVVGISTEGGKVTSVRVRQPDGSEQDYPCDYAFSTMPVKHLISALTPPAPAHIQNISDNLVYRVFITVGLLLNRLHLGGGCTGQDLFEKMPDNWIYIQEPGVQVGRLQFFNNWSPYMVANPDHVWIGLEYFCNEGDELWRMDDDALAAFAAEEVERIGIIRRDALLDHTVVRVPKTYPAYFGAYDHFSEITEYVDMFENLYLLGRNGMHRYNNQDHSMLTAMVAVDNIVAGRTDKANIWSVNTEGEYHEEK